MDKRSLLFFFVLTLTFLGTKFAWEWYYSDQDKLWHAQQKAKENLVVQELTAEMDKKNVKRSDLNFYTLYDEAMDPLAEGILLDNVLISIATSNAMPERIFIEPNEKDEKGEKRVALKRLTTHVEMGHPVLYASDKEQRIPYMPLSEIGSYDLQIIIAPPGELSTVVYAKQEEGKLTIPLQILSKLKPQDYAFRAYNGLVLLNKDNTYVPVGLYYAKEETIVPLDAYSDFLPYLKLLSSEKQDALSATEQHYYVLENAFQQLVFSTQGGALIEVNLPLKSEQDPLSPVYPIEYDREIAKLTPRNEIFPFYPHYTPNSPKTLVEGKQGGYYPLLRRDLATKNSLLRVHPSYYACNILSQYPEVAELHYEVTEYTENKIIFVAKQPHRTITKSYSFPSDITAAPYVVDLQIKIEGDARGLYITTGTPEVEWISGAAAPNLRLCQSKNKHQEVESLELPNDTQSVNSIHADWVCNSNGFFGLILHPLNSTAEGYKTLKVPAEVLPSRLEIIESAHFTPDKLTGYAMMLPFPKAGGELSFRFIATPLSSPLLKTLDRTYYNSTTQYQPDYIEAISMQGWLSFITAPFSKFLLFIMRIFYYLTGSWAIAIIFLTITLRLLLFPFNTWSMRSMKKTQEVAPLIQKIQEKYKNDKQRMQMEIANLYREKKINPLSGCLPMLIQIPFLFSMFDVLKTTFELRGAPFIPGWIDNLAAPDVLFSWGTPILFLGSNFHLLPILLGAVMFLQSHLSTQMPKDATQMTEAQRQQRAMGTIMPLVFTFFFYHFPSGLNLYWLFSTLFGIVQQWLFNKYGKKASK